MFNQLAGPHMERVEERSIGKGKQVTSCWPWRCILCHSPRLHCCSIHLGVVSVTRQQTTWVQEEADASQDAPSHPPLTHCNSRRSRAMLTVQTVLRCLWRQLAGGCGIERTWPRLQGAAMSFLPCPAFLHGLVSCHSLVLSGFYQSLQTKDQSQLQTFGHAAFSSPYTNSNTPSYPGWLMMFICSQAVHHVLCNSFFDSYLRSGGWYLGCVLQVRCCASLLH